MGTNVDRSVIALLVVCIISISIIPIFSVMGRKVITSSEDTVGGEECVFSNGEKDEKVF